MPLTYRSMFKDGDKPLVGSDNHNLGVRVKPHPYPDVDVEPDGTVSPADGGMYSGPRKLDHLLSY